MSVYGRNSHYFAPHTVTILTAIYISNWSLRVLGHCFPILNEGVPQSQWD